VAFDGSTGMPIEREVSLRCKRTMPGRYSDRVMRAGNVACDLVLAEELTVGGGKAEGFGDQWVSEGNFASQVQHRFLPQFRDTSECPCMSLLVYRLLPIAPRSVSVILDNLKRSELATCSTPSNTDHHHVQHHLDTLSDQARPSLQYRHHTLHSTMATDENAFVMRKNLDLAPEIWDVVVSFLRSKDPRDGRELNEGSWTSPQHDLASVMCVSPVSLAPVFVRDCRGRLAVDRLIGRQR
jgi:hypothetical protein